ncbi:MAG: 50S ribosomal protein L4 [Planctomycetes bacterium]|nr:50S ribosomal protein L4 [Planctomycetota bacterium]
MKYQYWIRTAERSAASNSTPNFSAVASGTTCSSRLSSRTGQTVDRERSRRRVGPMCMVPRKLYRQKGTGRARAGNLRTPVRVGGGHAFAKKNIDFDQKLNRKMRRLARNSAILAKAKSGRAIIVSGLKFESPSTKKMAKAIKSVDAAHNTLLTHLGADSNLVKSGRNIPVLTLKSLYDINAYDVLRSAKLVFTPEAFKALVGDPVNLGRSVEA